MPRAQAPVVAAGAVVLRGKGDSVEVLLVHRPKYDDWSFPKGKLDRGEHALTAAVREVAEETGLRVRLGRPLDDQHYEIANGRAKVVHYWLARVRGDDDISGYAANDEIDQVRWVPLAKAGKLLTYPHDRRTLAQAAKRRRKTTTVVVLRHAKARSRAHWRADDRFRPLLRTGDLQSQRLAPLLAAYGITDLVSSSSVRCVSTLVPYADAAGRSITSDDRFTEEDATVAGVTEAVQELVDSGRRVVVCTHRPVLPHVFDVLGLVDPLLEPAELVVAHVRRGDVVAVEHFGVR